MSNDLLSVRLRKPWGAHAPGEAVLVDRARAVKLEEDGLGSIEPPATEVDHETKAPARPPRDKMVHSAPRRKGAR